MAKKIQAVASYGPRITGEPPRLQLILDQPPAPFLTVLLGRRPCRRPPRGAHTPARGVRAMPTWRPEAIIFRPQRDAHRFGAAAGAVPGSRAPGRRAGPLVRPHPARWVRACRGRDVCRLHGSGRLPPRRAARPFRGARAPGAILGGLRELRPHPDVAAGLERLLGGKLRLATLTNGTVGPDLALARAERAATLLRARPRCGGHDAVEAAPRAVRPCGQAAGLAESS